MNLRQTIGTWMGTAVVALAIFFVLSGIIWFIYLNFFFALNPALTTVEKIAGYSFFLLAFVLPAALSLWAGYRIAPMPSKKVATWALVPAALAFLVSVIKALSSERINTGYSDVIEWLSERPALGLLIGAIIAWLFTKEKKGEEAPIIKRTSENVLDSELN